MRMESRGRPRFVAVRFDKKEGKAVCFDFHMRKSISALGEVYASVKHV